MIVGTSQIDITPSPGIELLGFAIRPQPSTGVLDPLAVRGLYLEDGRQRLLWLHADLAALERPFVDEVRQGVEKELGIPAANVLVAATHTHSAPAAISGNCMGRIDADYIAWLGKRFRLAARAALKNPEKCRPLAVEGYLELGVDRRRRASAHTDPRVGAVGLCRSDGTLKAVLLSYAMHPVCLRQSCISADWPGETARILSQALPGQPTVLVSSGACANIDPPQVGVTAEQMRAWGALVAESVLQKLRAAAASDLPEDGGALRVASVVVPLPLENWILSQIHEYADGCLADSAGRREFQEKFALAVEAWRQTMVQRLQRNEPPLADAELFGVALNETVWLAVNAEVFSRFTDLVRGGDHRTIYTVGCANGMLGYLPTLTAYDEGDYEVKWSMLFYNLLRPRRGGLELLAHNARLLTAELSRQGEGVPGP